MRELLRYCFQDLGVRRVTAKCFLDNYTSWRLMEQVGMRRETRQSANRCTDPVNGSTRLTRSSCRLRRALVKTVCTAATLGCLPTNAPQRDLIPDLQRIDAKAGRRPR